MARRKKSLGGEQFTRPVDPALMKRLCQRVNEMPQEQRRDFEGRSIGLIAFLHDEEMPEDGPSDRASVLVSFDLRMRALSRLHAYPKYAAWTLQLGDNNREPDLIHQVLVEVAAEAPLIGDERDEFDPDDFFQRALAKVESQGRG